jgi:putative redox protein
MATSSVNLRLEGEMRFTANTASGHEIRLDTKVDGAGGDAGARPVEALLAALGACTAMDVISIPRKMRQEVSAYSVRVEGERAEARPRVFTSIRVLHALRGKLAEERVRRAIDLSISAYCPVHAMLAPSVPISSRYEITDESGATEAEGEVLAGETGDG